MKEVNLHSHDSSPALVGVRRAVTQIKRKALDDVDQTPAAIRRNVSQNLSQSILSQMPPKDHVRRLVQRTRNDGNQIPVQPATRGDIVLPLRYFLLHIIICAKKHSVANLMSKLNRNCVRFKNGQIIK